MTSKDNPLDLLLRKLGTHAPLDEDDRRAVLALPYTVRTLEPQGYLVREGDSPVVTGILLSGFAFRQS